MTNKVIGFWKRMSFWNKLRSIITAILASTEATMYIKDASAWTMILSFGLGVIVILITHLFEDKNDNDIADIFEP